MTTTTQLPNYRIYDRTGGGVTYDIYASSMEDAIAQGREWIEDGDWEQDEMQTALDCVVREIVRHRKYRAKVVDIEHGTYLVLGPKRMYLAGQYDGVTPETLDAIREACAECGLTDSDTLEEAIDEHIDATEGAEALYLDWEDYDEWYREQESLVGGCRENPGCWGSGHGSTKITEVCALCGFYRTTDSGATDRSNGQQATRVSYEDADERSLAWAMPSEVKVNDAAVTLDWQYMTATYTVAADRIAVDRPSSGEEIEIPSGKSIRFAKFETDAEEDADEATFTAAFTRCASN